MVHSGIHSAGGSLELVMDPWLSPRIIPYECEVMSAEWGSVLLWELHLKPHGFLRVLAMMVAVLGI